MPSRPLAQPQRISSIDNAAIKRIGRLIDSPRERREAGLAVIEGEHLVDTFARAGFEFTMLAVSTEGFESAGLRTLFDRCAAHQRFVLTTRVFEKVSSLTSPAGILAVVSIPKREGRLAARSDAVYLDRLQDAGNVGTILRTAAAAGIGDVVFGRGTVDPWSPRVLRAAMGAHGALRIQEADLGSALAGAVQHQVLTTASDGAINLFEADLRPPTIWLFGNEGAGVAPELRALASTSVRIPLASGVESLNVAASVAVCLFEQRRQRLTKPSSERTAARRLR